MLMSGQGWRLPSHPIHHSTNREMEVQPRNDLPKVNRTTGEPHCTTRLPPVGPRGSVCVTNRCHGVSVLLVPFFYTYVASSVLGSNWGLTTKGVSENVPAERVLIGLPKFKLTYNLRS